MKTFRLKKPFSCRSTNPIVKFICKEAFDQRVTMYDLSRRAGISKDTIRHWRYKSTPNLKDAEAVLNVLGYELIAARINRKGKRDD